MTSQTGRARVLVPARVERDAVTYVRALLEHPMDTGLARDSDGNPIPPWFVNEVEVTYAGERVARFEWTSGISRDPYVALPLQATREAAVTVVWKDNKGGRFTATADIRFA